MTERESGKIKFYSKDKRFGFIKRDGGRGDAYYHISEVRFNSDPDANQAVTFTIAQGPKGPVAKDIKLPEENVPLTPYTFVPVALSTTDNLRLVAQSKLLEIPGHDGASGHSRLSGELNVCLETLTPTLVGARRITLEMPPKKFQNEEGKARSLLEPWRLEDGRVVISGTSIKGMLRHYIGALFNAPMERVEERYFSYRPNLSMEGTPGIFTDEKGSYRIEMRESVVRKAAGDCIEVDVLPYGRNSLFVHSDVIRANTNFEIGYRINMGEQVLCAERPMAKKMNKKTNKLELKTNRHGKPIYLYKISGNPSNCWLSDDDYFLLRYHGGMDRKGGMAALHGSPRYTYEFVFTKRKAMGRSIKATIGPDIINEYRRTYRELYDDMTGHLSSRHPAIKKANEGAQGVEIQNPVSKGKPILEPNTLIFAEVVIRKGDDGSDYVDRLISFGHHFHYRWAYRDSVCTLDRPRSARRRPELSMLDEEQVSKEASRLTASRALFGYSAEQNIHGKRFGGDYSRLAGRISVNHALEFCKNPADDFRFVAEGKPFALKELGSPKPSAVEFYVKQDPGRCQKELSTYGDSKDSPDSVLAGRKFYRHQAAAADDDTLYSAPHKDERNHRAPLVRYVSRHKTQFRFTIRFIDLDRFELGALLFILDIHCARKHLAGLGTAPVPEGSSPDYALKLGYARPLGWGSILTRLKRATLIKVDNHKAIPRFEKLDGQLMEEWQNKLIREFLCQMDSDSDAIHRCLNAWAYASEKKVEYPRKKDEIYEFHTEIRRKHAKARRTGESFDFGEAFSRRAQNVGPGE